MDADEKRERKSSDANGELMGLLGGESFSNLRNGHMEKDLRILLKG